MFMPKGWVYQIEVFDADELPVCKVQIRNLEYAKQLKQSLYNLFKANDGFSVELDVIEG